MDHNTVESEFLRPLVGAWCAKLNLAKESRKDWEEVANECTMFYGQSSKAMWDSDYSKKFFAGNALPRFRMVMNKAFEMVAIYAPNLFWRVPHRNVEPRKQLDLPSGLMQQAQQDPEMQMLLQQQQQMGEAADIVSELLSHSLNFMPEQQPGGGLSEHCNRCVVDTLITGMGVLATRPYKLPGSDRVRVGSFRVNPLDVFFDPDFKTVDDARWIAIRHRELQSEVEARFKLPRGSLDGKGTDESLGQYAELATDPLASENRKNNQTQNVIVWYEIFSKSGVGISNSRTDPAIRDHLNSVAGQYAYVAICPTCPYPLNMPSAALRAGATDVDVRQAFRWPMETWRGDRWPIEISSFYYNTDSPYPMPPLAPGIGELRLLNFLVSWYAQRVWSSSRDFWAVAQQYEDHFNKIIADGKDQSVMPIPVGVKPDEAVRIFTQPESRLDIARLIEMVSSMFDRRVGLTATIYGQNEGGTQNRTAEETMSKQRMVMARPEFMQQRIVDWMGKVAQLEAFATRLFVGAKDMEPLVGPVGAMLWGNYVQNSDAEYVLNQFQYSVAAASIRRPNRERDIGNFQQVMGQFLPVFTDYAQRTNNYNPFNAVIGRWGELHDADMESLFIPPPDQPSEEDAQLQKQVQGLELEKLSAEVRKIEADAGKLAAEATATQQQPVIQQHQALAEVEIKKAESGLKQHELQQKVQMDRMKSLLGIELEQDRHEQQLEHDEELHDQGLRQSEETHEQRLHQKAVLDYAKQRAARRGSDGE